MRSLLPTPPAARSPAGDESQSKRAVIHVGKWNGHRKVRHKFLSAILSLADYCANDIARSAKYTLLDLSFQCLLLCSQRTAYQIAEIVDADDIVERIVHRLVTREIGLAEDRRLTIERFIHVDGLDYLAPRIENGAYGSRAVIPHYIGRDTDIVCTALDKDRGGAVSGFCCLMSLTPSRQLCCASGKATIVLGITLNSS